jgi:hypothetical protein
LAEYAIGSKAGKVAIRQVAIRLCNLADFRAPNDGW